MAKIQTHRKSATTVGPRANANSRSRFPPTAASSSHSSSASTTTAVAAAGRSSGADDAPQTRWTFLSNHSHVLLLLARDPSMVLREVAQRVGITERAVQRIIVELEEGGFIEREKTGRRNHYTILIDKQLRHPIEAHRTIGDLIRLINQV